MRELAVRIRFTRHSLGNVKQKTGGRFVLPRSPSGSVIFMATWHQANMRYAAQVLNKHQDEVLKIHWDIAVDAVVESDCWYRRYYTVTGGKQRYVLHESFFPGQVVGFNCVVPPAITDDDLWRLMTTAGQYRGLSPFRPGEYGQYEVVTIRPRRVPEADRCGAQDSRESDKAETPPSCELGGALKR